MAATSNSFEFSASGIASFTNGLVVKSKVHTIVGHIEEEYKSIADQLEDLEGDEIISKSYVHDDLEALMGYLAKSFTPESPYYADLSIHAKIPDVLENIKETMVDLGGLLDRAQRSAKRGRPVKDFKKRLESDCDELGDGLKELKAVVKEIKNNKPSKSKTLAPPNDQLASLSLADSAKPSTSKSSSDKRVLDVQMVTEPSKEAYRGPKADDSGSENESPQSRSASDHSDSDAHSDVESIDEQPKKKAKPQPSRAQTAPGYMFHDGSEATKRGKQRKTEKPNSAPQPPYPPPPPSQYGAPPQPPHPHYGAPSPPYVTATGLAYHNPYDPFHLQTATAGMAMFGGYGAPPGNFGSNNITGNYISDIGNNNSRVYGRRRKS